MSQRSGALNATTFVVLGDGLAAGAGDFGMSEELQRYCFPALAARQIGTRFTQPLMEPPGIGPVIGFPALPVRLPQPLQTTVLKESPPAGLFSNVSVPGMKLADALTRRPVSPLIHRSDDLQTAINLILGMPGLLVPGTQTMPTLVEYGLFQQPTLLLVALGMFDIVDAALKGDPAWIPDDVSFRLNYASVLSPFGRVPATVVASTIPDPADTAVFTRVADSARVVKADAAVLSALFGLREQEYLTPKGLVEVGCHVITRTAARLPEGAVVPASVVARISERTASLNAQIRAVAREQGALVLDLHALFAELKREGVTVGGRRLTTDYLGGLYSLNGVSPGAAGHGLIANGLITLLNMSCGKSYAPVDLAELVELDPVTQYRLAPGPVTTAADLTAAPAAAPRVPAPGTRRVPGEEPLRTHITLPASLEAALPLNTETSYFGDALRAAHTTLAQDLPSGSAPNTLFGGLCLVQSHVQGTVRVRFTPPDGDLSRFVLSMGKGLTGQDSLLAAPQFFKFPAIGNTVTDVAGMASTGELNLATGEVSKLNVNVRFGNSALVALASVNPKIPPAPIAFSNEARQEPEDRPYGSAWAKFEQRADGTLDFLMSGVSFVPLGTGFGGEPSRFPLPFSGPAMQCASIPAVGTVRHPHLCLSTKAPEGVPGGEQRPDIPINTVREYTVSSYNTACGDTFSLNIPEMEGGATARSHLVGRLLIQFGERSGDSVPVAVSTLVPGGMFVTPPGSPGAREFPGLPGLLGHDETLRFKRISYDMKGVYWVDDPFEIALGSVDLKTGRLLGNFLFRGFIVQDVILALRRLEPRTPKSSWSMRGPAAFERDRSGQTVFGYRGAVRMPYPEGYGFPRPDLTSLYEAGPGSALDPYIFIQAMDGVAPTPAGKSGAAHGAQASNGQRFSYKYHIPGYPSGTPAAFEYVNEALGGRFQMGSLVWVSFGNANRETEAGECDCVTFTGIGLWSLDMSRLHMATVQISTAPALPYVSILIDGGTVSNVNTKPATAVMPFPGTPLA